MSLNKLLILLLVNVASAKFKGSKTGGGAAGSGSRETSPNPAGGSQSALIDDRNSNDKKGCFDAMTLFTTPNGPVAAKDLTTGAVVRALEPDGTMVWDEVILKSSEEPTNGTIELVQITSGQHTLALTPTHWLHRGPECCGAGTLAPAEDIKVGDTIWAISEGVLAKEPVVAVDIIHRPAVSNVWLLQSATNQGVRSLVADGVAAVSFTSGCRLMESHGVEAADQLFHPLRALYRQTPSLFHSATATNIHDDTPLVRAGRMLMDVVADCVEFGMLNCTESDVRPRVDAVVSQAEAQLPDSFIADALTGLQAMPAGGSMATRRLVDTASTFVNVSGWSHALATRHIMTVVVSTAVSICDSSSGCHNSTVPDWSIALFVLAGALLVGIPVLVVSLVKRQRRAQTAATATRSKIATAIA